MCRPTRMMCGLAGLSCGRTSQSGVACYQTKQDVKCNNGDATNAVLGARNRISWHCSSETKGRFVSMLHRIPPRTRDFQIPGLGKQSTIATGLRRICLRP